MCFNPILSIFYTGKYSANPNHTNDTQHIPANQANSTSIHNNNNGNSVESSSVANNTRSSVTTTNALTNGSYDHEKATPEVPLIHASSRKTHKMRKKLKSKAVRKQQQLHHHQSHANNAVGNDRRGGGSDCD